MKLHLGCGPRYLPGYIHVDILKYNHIDILADICDLSQIPNESVDDIYASHVLEHFNRYQILPVLREWNRVLKINGVIHISVPDFLAVIEHYQSNEYLPELIGLVCGGQKNEYDIHKMVYDEKLLTQFLNESGFDDVKRYSWQDYLPCDYDDYSKCYLPHKNFDNGRLMSLNLAGIKVKSAPFEDPSNDLLFAMGIKKNYT